jgi:adenylate cyclase class 2
MLEVELKYALTNAPTFGDKFASLGARKQATLVEEDQYFNAPDRDFGSTDEALRLRKVGSANILTYKGPKKELSSKTRTEIEVMLAEGDDNAKRCAELLSHAGFRPTRVVRKTRTKYEWDHQGFPVTASIDDVDGLGQFIELEILVSEPDMGRARDVLLKLADSFGLAHQERRSYLEMLLSKNHGER